MSARFVRRALLAAAAANLLFGVWVSFGKAGFSDLYLLTSWCRAWLDGLNPYASGSVTDYPPWALVELSPLALVPRAALPTIWVVINLVCALLLAAILAAQSGESPDHRRNLMWLLLATAPIRALGQFSHLTFVLAIAGAFMPSVAGGLLVGLSLMKPQIGGVVLLWLLLRRDWTRALLALIVPAILVAVFLIRVPIGVPALVEGYREAIARLYIDPTAIPGHSDLRFWLWSIWPEARGNLLLSAGTLLILLAPAIYAGLVHHRMDRERDLRLLALCGVISLLAVRHLSYDFILLLPVIVAWRRPPFALRAHAPIVLFAGLTSLLVLAIPSWVRLAQTLGASALAPILQLDRVMCLAVWALLSVQLSRPRPASRSLP